MGSPAATPSTPKAQSDLEGTKGSEERQDPRYRTKRCKHDLRGDCPYGHNCNYIHVSPQPLLSYFTHPTYYPYIHIEPSMMTASPVRREAHQLGMARGTLSLDMSAAALGPYLAGAYPAARPSTPSSSTTDMSSPLSSRFAQLSPTEASPRPRRSRHRSDNGGCFYRTKPCKFFHTTGRCVKGDRCNFIHGYPSAYRSENGEKKRVKEQSSKGQERTPRPSSKKPSSPCKGESREDGSNYYPIQWRVIGGGVLMGGQRDVCETYYNTGRCEEGPNCKFAHPIADDDDEVIVVSESESSTTPLVWSPRSPLSPVPPMPIMLMLPPSPRPTPPPQHVVQTGECRIVLNGETLEPYEEIAYTAGEAADLSITPKDDSLLSARTIVRPVSTPPATTTTFKKVERLFQAEMP